MTRFRSSARYGLEFSSILMGARAKGLNWELRVKTGISASWPAAGAAPEAFFYYWICDRLEPGLFDDVICSHGPAWARASGVQLERLAWI